VRLFLRFLVLVLALFAIAAGALAGGALAGAKTGFYVFKDFRTSAAVEFRDMKGRVVSRRVATVHREGNLSACADSRHVLASARWRGFPTYDVNVGSFPAGVSTADGLADLNAGHAAWQGSWTTDCANVPGASPYRAFFGEETNAPASLATLTIDGENVVQFRSLTGTVCDGAVACVVAFSLSGRFVEADLALEAHPSRFGDFSWTTEDRTWSTGNSGEFAVIDVATHEWGHFAGLNHANQSPALTMYPFVHDGMQTLGLGDMKGLHARY
jgi:hypothetical protein